MPAKKKTGTFQAFNPRTNSWVKYKFVHGRPRIMNVRQGTTKPFKGVRKK